MTVFALADTDDPRRLVPGDADEVRDLAQRWRADGEALGELADRCRRVDLRAEWTGRASDAFHVALAAHCRQLGEEAEVYAQAVAALLPFADELESAQRRARHAAELWAEAEGQDRVRAAPGLTGSDADAAARASRLRDGVDELRGQAERILRQAQEDAARAEALAARRLDALIGRVPSTSALEAPGTVAFAALTDGLALPALLAALGSLTGAQAAAFLRKHPTLLADLQALGADTIAAWWRSLPAPQRDVLAQHAPAIVGRLDGIPASVRSSVNEKRLLADIAAAASESARATRRLLDTSPTDPVAFAAALAAANTAADRLAQLKAIRRAFGDGPSGAPPHQLYSYDPGPHIMVALSTGLIDEAEHVTVIVPGMGTTAGDIGSYVGAAADLRRQQWTDSGVPLGGLAVISWLDYEPPSATDAAGVLHDDLARAGGVRLARTLDGLGALRDWSAESPHLSVVAHSYGTAVAAEALVRPGSGAGNLVLLGSAGIPIDAPHASTLHVPDGQVYASQGSHDGWAPLGQLGSGRLDPTDPRYGAHVFSAEEATVGGAHGEAITQHGPFGGEDGVSYLDQESSAFLATSEATMGLGDRLPEAGTPQQRRTLQYLDRFVQG